MYWENLTCSEFKDAVEKSGGVCIIPIGCLEKHGNQLPMGTDMFIARAIASRAAESEDIVIFPHYYFSQVSEVRHKLGTVALPASLQISLLEAVCEEISRNGFDKILILNGHGGNNCFLKYFCQTMLDKRRPYNIFLKNAFSETFDALVQKYEFGEVGHADAAETACIMAIAPELVHMERVNIEETKRLERFKSLKEVAIYSGFDWYADHPHHIAGDPSKASKDIGEDFLNTFSKELIKAIKIIKADSEAGRLSKEFYELIEKPGI